VRLCNVLHIQSICCQCHGTEKCRFGAAVSCMPNLRRLRTDWVELIEPTSRRAGDHDGLSISPGARSRLLSITGWLLTGDCMWRPAGVGMRRTLRVLELEDYSGLDWGVLGARVACLSQLQVRETVLWMFHLNTAVQCVDQLCCFTCCTLTLG
jgi:hypothetical protein